MEHYSQQPVSHTIDVTLLEVASEGDADAHEGIQNTVEHSRTPSQVLICTPYQAAAGHDEDIPEGQQPSIGHGCTSPPNEPMGERSMGHEGEGRTESTCSGMRMQPMTLGLLNAVREGDSKKLEELLDEEEMGHKALQEEVVQVQPLQTEEHQDDLRQEVLRATPRTSILLQGRTSDWDTVLHIAARLHHFNLVHLISEGKGLVVDVAVKNKKGETPLHCAAATGNVDIINLLIEMAGVDSKKMQLLRERKCNGETSLHEAVRWDNIEAVKILIEEDVKVQNIREMCSSHRALVEIEDDKCVSPLYLAATLCRHDIAKFLTKKHGDDQYPAASYAGPEKKTALHAAVLLSEDISNLLIEWEMGLTKKTDLYGNTPLHLLASTRDTSIAELLLKTDACAGYREDAEGSLPIHVAAANGKLKMIKLLLKYCPNCVWSCNIFGQTILHIAVQNRRYGVVNYICSKQRFVDMFNCRDKDGNTALHLAVLQGNQFIFCRLMLRREVYLSFTNNEEQTPLDLAHLSLAPDILYMEAPRRWIMYDLVFAGAELSTCRWDHFTTKEAKLDREKLSEAVTKTAGLLAVCSVLILNITFAAPFYVGKYVDLSNSNDMPRTIWLELLASFRMFIICDAIAFVFAATATFCFSYAGSSVVDRRMRSGFLAVGAACLRSAIVSMVSSFMLGLYLLVAPINPQWATDLCSIAIIALIPQSTSVFKMGMHFWVVGRRLGFRKWCHSLLSRVPGQRPRRIRFRIFWLPLHAFVVLSDLLLPLVIIIGFITFSRMLTKSLGAQGLMDSAWT